MKVVILAAGRGTRLGQLTADKPKCLLDFGKESILQRQCRMLRESGIAAQDIIIVSGYKASLLESFGYHTIYNHRFYNTDNAYSLGLALQALSSVDEDTLILDGDLVFDEEVVTGILMAPSDSIMVQKNILSKSGTGVQINDLGNVLEVGKHLKHCQYNFLGIMKLSATSCDSLKQVMLDEKNASCWYTVPLNNHLNLLSLKASVISGKVVGINTYYDYIHAKDLFGIENCKILITGVTGFLGKKIEAILEREYKIIGLSRHGGKNSEHIDLLDFQQLEAFIELKKPSIIIHTVAIADPETCDSDQTIAYRINVETTENLCKICKKRGIKIIFISTDYVFDGESNQPYQSDDIREPKNYYGYTKMLAEDIVKDVNGSLIVRIPVLYGYNDNNDKGTFVTKLFERLENGKEIILLDNQQIRYPVLIDEVAIALTKILSAQGIIQLSSNQPVTKYTWGKSVAKIFGYDESMIRPSTEPYKGSPRPPHTKMDTSKADSYGIKISDVDEGLQILKKQMSCIFKLIYKSKPDEHLYGVNVGEFRYNIGRILGNVILPEYIQQTDCVVPVPNSGLYYAMGLSKAIGKPYVQGLVKSDSKRSFNIGNLEDREKVLEAKIIPIRELLAGKTILLVDEAIFTGTTLRVVCDMLKACGTKAIHICIPTPICYSRCQQYMQPDRAVLTEQVQPTQLAEFFRVESVSNLPFSLFLREINQIQKFMCSDCFQQNECKKCERY